MLIARTLPDPAEARLALAATEDAFYQDVTDENLDRFMTIAEPERTHGVFDGDRLVGTGAIFTRDLTFPLSGPSPIAAVTAVAVRPDERRRGALTTLMRAQLHELHEHGAEPVAVLWASEGGIYGRFGYGLASRHAVLEVPRPTRWRADVDAGPDRVRLLPGDEAAPALRAVHRRYTATRVGSLSRPEAAWDIYHNDLPSSLGGRSKLRHAVHPDGYALFRVKQDWESSWHGPRGKVDVRELVAVSPHAHAALWQFLTTLDLMGQVGYANAPLDDPLPHQLVDPRHAGTRVLDGLYVRLVDVGRALTARGYAAPLDVVLDVTDEFCPWNAGRWRLRAGADGTPDVTRTDDDADLACDVSVLGAAYLGASRLTTLAAAGRVRELRPGALRAANTAFVGENEPHCLEVF